MYLEDLCVNQIDGSEALRLVKKGEKVYIRMTCAAIVSRVHIVNEEIWTVAHNPLTGEDCSERLSEKDFDSDFYRFYY